MLARALPHLHLFARMCVSVSVYWCCINKSNQRTFLSNPTQNETETRMFEEELGWVCYVRYCVIIFRVYAGSRGNGNGSRSCLLDYFRVNGGGVGAG